MPERNTTPLVQEYIPQLHPATTVVQSHHWTETLRQEADAGIAIATQGEPCRGW
jgi:hypothetical protein